MLFKNKPTIKSLKQYDDASQSKRLWYTNGGIKTFYLGPKKYIHFEKVLQLNIEDMTYLVDVTNNLNKDIYKKQLTKFFPYMPISLYR